MAKSLLLIFCATLLTIAGCSKEPQPSGPVVTTGVLTGRVTDIETGAPLSGVIVSSIPPSQSVTTDGNGVYRMPTVTPGVYNMRAIKNGYGHATISVSVTAGQTTSADIPMRKDVVIGNPPTVPASPTPADNSTNQPFTVTLRWSASDPDGDALTYDVYFGKSNPPGTPVATDLSNSSHLQANLDSNTTYYWFVVAKDNKGGNTVGPVWRFTTRATTGNPNDGKGAGKALVFSDAGNYVSVPNSSSLYLNDGSFTVEAWVYPTALSGTSFLWNVILNKSHSNEDIDYLFGIDGNGRFSFITRSLSNFIQSSFSAQLNQWYHVAGVQNVTTGKVSLYVDGALVAEETLSGFPTGNTAPLWIGAREYLNKGTPSDGFKGAIDEVRIWNVARTGQQILAAKNTRLVGNETGLVANFRFDEGSGDATQDVGGNFVGTLIGLPIWINSTAPID